MMKTVLAFSAALLLGGACACADGPALAAGVRVQDGSSALAVDWGHAAPETADWNNDGRNDLIVGQFYQGKVRLYLNQGSTNAALFNGSSFVKSGGADIATEYG